MDVPIAAPPSSFATPPVPPSAAKQSVTIILLVILVLGVLLLFLIGSRQRVFGVIVQLIVCGLAVFALLMGEGQWRHLDLRVRAVRHAWNVPVPPPAPGFPHSQSQPLSHDVAIGPSANVSTAPGWRMVQRPSFIPTALQTPFFGFTAPSGSPAAAAADSMRSPTSATWPWYAETSSWRQATSADSFTAAPPPPTLAVPSYAATATVATAAAAPFPLTNTFTHTPAPPPTPTLTPPPPPPMSTTRPAGFAPRPSPYTRAIGGS